MIIQIERLSDDELQKRTWGFITMDSTSELKIYLERYCVSTRTTKRHGWKPVKTYQRLARRGENDITAKEVEMPFNVLTEVRNRMSDISIRIWPERTS